MIKKLALIIGFIICLSSCGKDYVYRIEGELSNLEDQTVYAVFEKDNYKVVDTVACTKPGQFQIDQNEAGFHCVTIFFADKEHWVTAYLEPGETVKITGDACSITLRPAGVGRTGCRFRSNNLIPSSSSSFWIIILNVGCVTLQCSAAFAK